MRFSYTLNWFQRLTSKVSERVFAAIEVFFCQSKKAHIMLTSLCFARIVRSTCYRAIWAKTDLFDEGLGNIFPPN